MIRGATHHGVTWKMDDSDDPELSPHLSKAANEIGWANPSKTLIKASYIANAQRLEDAKAKSNRIGKINNSPTGLAQTWSDDDNSPTYI